MCLAGESMPESEDNEVKAATMFCSVKIDKKSGDLLVEYDLKLCFNQQIEM